MLDAGTVVKNLQDMRDDGHLSDALLRKAVRSISEADDRYDWVGVYLLGDGEELWLHNYVGEPTPHAKIALGTGVTGKAVADHRNANVKDLGSQEDAVRRTADAQSQLVILIRAGDAIYGSIDIDSEAEGAFTEDDEIALIGIADKLAEQLAAERR